LSVTINLLYHERISSNRMEVLFLVLRILFLSLLIWHVNVSGADILAVVFFGFFNLFVFSSVNYRTLVIRLTPESLKLTFGIFTWRVPLDNVEECRLDEMPLLMKIGDAGIHFMTIRKRY
jgi:hypothetical protein